MPLSPTLLPSGRSRLPSCETCISFFKIFNIQFFCLSRMSKLYITLPENHTTSLGREKREHVNFLGTTSGITKFQGR